MNRALRAGLAIAGGAGALAVAIGPLRSSAEYLGNVSGVQQGIGIGERDCLNSLHYEYLGSFVLTQAELQVLLPVPGASNPGELTQVSPAFTAMLHNPRALQIETVAVSKATSLQDSATQMNELQSGMSNADEVNQAIRFERSDEGLGTVNSADTYSIDPPARGSLMRAGLQGDVVVDVNVTACTLPSPEPTR